MLFPGYKTPTDEVSNVVNLFEKFPPEEGEHKELMSEESLITDAFLEKLTHEEAFTTTAEILVQNRMKFLKAAGYSDNQIQVLIDRERANKSS